MCCLASTLVPGFKCSTPWPGGPRLGHRCLCLLLVYRAVPPSAGESLPVKPAVPWLRTEFTLGLPDTNLLPLFDVVKLKN